MSSIVAQFLHVDGTPVIEEVIGVGGSGLIIEQRHFAIKIPLLSRDVEIDGVSTSTGRLTREEGAFDERQSKIDQIEHEKAVYRRLGSHTGIVPCFDLSSTDPFIRMAWMKHGDLRHYLARERPDPKTQLSWVTDMAHTLAHIHRCRVLATDVRTDNLLLDDNLSIMFADFGESTLLPLEWDMGEPDEDGYSVSTDIGQFGAAMYEILTGRHCTFDLMQDWKETGDALTWPRRDSLPSTAGLWLGHIVEACWSKAAFTSADELAAALDKEHVGLRDAGFDDHARRHALL